jgi:signal transduction histidine kinase
MGAVQLWRVVAVFRVATLIYSGAIIVRDHNDYAHPAGGLAALAAMIVWSVVVAAAYARPGGRRPWVIATDVAVAAGIVLATRLVDSAARIDHGHATLAMFWAAAPVLACAVAGGPWAGGAGAAVISVADVIERRSLGQSTFNGIVLLVLCGVVGGFLVRLWEQAEAATKAAAAIEAAAAERTRIARGIHDSVLQVLAFVARRGAELGGPAAELGRLAGEQEITLRGLVATQSAPIRAGRTDIVGLLTRHEAERVTVSGPAEPVWLTESTAAALSEAAVEALRNVVRHAGEHAHAWVLVDSDDTEVIVTVRDDGVGFAADRLAHAVAEGRLGVAACIVDGIRGVGGHTLVTSEPNRGTEVELHVPRA